MARTKTLKDIFREVTELKQKAAVYDLLSSFLEGKYLPRDSAPNPAKISCQGAPVVAAVIEEIARELKDGAIEFRKQAKLQEAEEYDA